MPFYDYKCNDCSNIQEESHPMKGPLEKILCIKCKSANMEKMVSLSYVRFVGEWQTNQVRKI